MNVSKRVLTSVACIALALTAVPAYAQLAVWTGDGDGTTWGDANNWSPAVAPCGGPFDVTIDLPGATVQLNQICNINSLTLGFSPAPGEQRLLGGTTPPVLKIGAQSTLEAEGSITLEESSGIQSTSTSTSAQRGSLEPSETHYHIKVGGDWTNASTTLDDFELSQLALLIDGNGSLQQFEVAANLNCSNPFGHNLSLKTLGVQAGAAVVFRDATDNEEDGPVPPEVQVARGIGFQAGASITIDAAGVLYGTLQNDGAAVNTENGGFLASVGAACPVQSIHAMIALALVVALVGAIVIHRRKSIA